MSELVKPRRAILSVSDKEGLVGLGRALTDFGIEILSTGGTARALEDSGLTVLEVGEYTGFPEMMDGRIKTLHPRIHGGLLALRANAGHQEEMRRNEIAPIDLVVVNLYPFEETLAGRAAGAEVIENIDIGGPAMIRSAAKNYQDVVVVVDPSDYAALVDELSANHGATRRDFRKRLAAKAFARTAAYDSLIAGWLRGPDKDFPERLTIAGGRPRKLRYGENPHQTACLYEITGDSRPGVTRAEQLQGKPLSYNNLNDANAAFELVSEFGEGTFAVAIIKHANPCGVGLGDSQKEAYEKALACDPVSAFGGIVASNMPLDEGTAAAIADIFTEVVIAPEVNKKARKILAARKNLRLLATGALADPAARGFEFRSLAGGYLVQGRDHGRISESDLRLVTERAPSEQEMKDLLFAFRVAKHVKSNAIVYAKGGATVGIGAGQMSRVDSCRIAARKAEDAAKSAGLDKPATVGSVVASDAFFPFADGLLAAAEAGATAVIQPGGSRRDDEVIAAANDAGLAMVLTGMRHFRH